MLTVNYWMDHRHRAPNGGARESIQGAKEICNPVCVTTLWTNQYPGALDSSCICIKRWPSRPSLEREARWTYKLYMPQYRGTPGPKNGNGWVGKWGGVWGTFGIALDINWGKYVIKKYIFDIIGKVKTHVERNGFQRERAKGMCVWRGIAQSQWVSPARFHRR